MTTRSQSQEPGSRKLEWKWTIRDWDQQIWDMGVLSGGLPHLLVSDRPSLPFSLEA